MTRTVRLAAAALSLALLVACGDDGDSSGSPSSSEPGGTAASTTSSAEPAPAGGVVEVLATANLKFVPNELTATVGTEFKGSLVQQGAIPHNIEIKDLGVDDADTTTTKDGDRRDFSFTPTKAGRFTFVCTIHAAQMTGTVTVS